MKKQPLLSALSVGLFTLGMVSNVHAAPITGQGIWESTLQGRDLDGDLSTFEAYYDSTLDMTWLADANYAGTTMDWATANNWAANLNPYNSGITGWRLPDTNPVDGTTADDVNYSSIGTEDRGYNVSAPGTLYAGSTASEMAYMFYNTLGNLGYCDPGSSTVSSCSGPQAGYGLSNTGPFSNLKSGIYWSATGYAPYTYTAWRFYMNYGLQDGFSKSKSYYAWAVHSGDVGVSAVPIPAAMWLFGSGLLGLLGVVKRKRAQTL